ncbi:MAG: argininosuccinate synthase, partial [Phycisphaerales bacterium]|nr:argininosuccinate synthase [Phycisphaerales bacterium]
HDLIERLNAIAGPHGVGRVDIIENRLVGMKSRGLYETPGGTVLVEALAALEHMVHSRETLHWREQIGLRMAELVYNGQWFTDLRRAISAAAESLAQRLDGEVVVRLYKGHATAIRRRADQSLYAEDFATFGADEVYDQKHAEGFIRLFSLPERIRAMKEQS